MTITAIAAQLLTHFSPEERSIPDHADYPGRNAAVMLAMNGALQELFGKASPWVRYDERGALMHAPAAVTISVTRDSTAATITSGWDAWMAGCSIVIGGSAFDNQIRNDSASVVLKIPHDGTTGSKTAVVYQDCLNLAADVMEVCEPVKANGKPLGAMASGDYPAGRSGEEDYGFHHRTIVSPAPVRVAGRIGQPFAFAVETWSKDAQTAPRPRLKIQPAPDADGFLEYRAMLAPPVVITDLSSNNTLPIPLQFIQTLFYPVARQHLTACPFYRSSDGAEEVGRAYRTAMELLASLNPSPSSGTRLRSPY